jgi:PAS domain S-box-containing protein
MSGSTVNKSGDATDSRPGEPPAKAVAPGVSGAEAIALRKQARLIDLAPAATLVRRLDGTITFWSQGAERLYGWRQDEAIGRRTYELLRTEFPEPETLASVVEKLRGGGVWSGELRHLTRDGRKLTVASYWLAELGPDGAVEELLESNTDITEQKRLQEHLEEQVQERTARLRESNSELEAFCYSLSHDMRGPLRAILGFTKFIVEDCGQELSQTAKDYLQKVSGAARRLDVLIRDVLALTQVSRQEVHLHPVDLQHLVAEIVRERPELQEPAAEVRVQGTLPAVHGHEALLTQIITNLLGNAVKFVHRGVKPKVRVRGEQTNGHVRLWVEDNGIGIERLAQRRVFELFGRNERTKDYEGTGIGLAIVRKAAERMGGRTGVESEPGKGSQFWVELPAAVASDHAKVERIAA